MSRSSHKSSIWIRLRVVGFEGFGVRFARPIYVEAGVRPLAGPTDWHYTTQQMRAWVGTERDARALLRAASESNDWDFDLAMEVGDELVR